LVNLPRGAGRQSVELLSVIGLGGFVAGEDLGQLGGIEGADPRKPNGSCKSVSASEGGPGSGSRFVIGYIIAAHPAL
jgi:hypothetical protein